MLAVAKAPHLPPTAQAHRSSVQRSYVTREQHTKQRALDGQVSGRHLVAVAMIRPADESLTFKILKQRIIVLSQS